jgi:hypothetical protein
MGETERDMKARKINQVAELNVPALLSMADDLESGHYKEYIGTFDMNQWEGCIAGLCAAKYGLRHWLDSQAFLGLPGTYPDDLFVHPKSRGKTPEQAARVIRHLAETGEVDWSKADKKPWYKFW